MPKKEYKWNNAKHLPPIDQHSIAKHDILRAYLTEYIRILVGNNFATDGMKLTLVDGFSGGGLYSTEDGKIHFGSPLIFLQALQEVEAEINTGKRKPFRIQSDFFFVEDKQSNLNHLNFVLKEQGYSDQINRNIFLRLGEFNLHATEIIDFIIKKGRARRSIFLLDQYGYSQVPFHIIRQILTQLPHAEIILTFAVDSLLDYINEDSRFKKTLEDVGIAHFLDWNKIRLWKQESNDWRLLIQSMLHSALVKGCGAKYFTPFFIRSTSSHRDYWLVHLSNHWRARDAMTQLHWQKHSYFIHYGGAGLKMLVGYDPKRDVRYTGQEELEFLFNDSARERSLNVLANDLPSLIFNNPDGISFEDLIRSTCNESPASAQIYKEALERGLFSKEIEVRGINGEMRRKGSSIKQTDIILPPRQRPIFF